MNLKMKNSGVVVTTKRSAGFTLIEILIALLVLSVGLVGLAALQLASLQRAHSSFHTSLATAAALDFEERAWIRLAERETPPCLSLDELNQIGTAVQTLWRSDGPSPRAGIPGFGVAVVRGAPNPSANPDFVPVTVTLGWGVVGSRVEPESFVYRFNSICRPVSDD